MTSTERPEGIETKRLFAAVRAKMFGSTDPVQIGRYTILGRLGAGGMGVVYRGRDPDLDRDVAIKVATRRVAEGTRGAALMGREAEALARLSHPNVVEVYAAGLLAEQPWIAMELVEGRTLREWLAAESPGESSILDVFLQAGRGLSAAHARGLVHRDFKPDNVLIGDDGRARVLDFGLARFDQRATDPPSIGSGSAPGVGSTAGEIVGTLMYMAPEQHRGEQVDAAADQYAFCLALFEAMAGRVPFAGATPVALAMSKEAGAWQRGTGKLPARLRPILRRGLAVRAVDRYPSMRALLAELERRPTRRGVIAAAAVLGGGLLWVALRQGPTPPDDCTVAAQNLDATWNAARRDDLREHITGLPVAFASSTWSRVETQLVGFAERWTVAHATACASVTSGHAVRCLGQRVDQLDAIVGVLLAIDGGELEHATAAVGALPRPAACLDGAKARPPPPGLGPAVAEAEKRLARAEALSAAGDYTAGLEAALEVAGEADRLGYDPLRGRAWLAVGSTQLEGGDIGGAVESLESAYYLARRGDARLVAARAATSLGLANSKAGDLDASSAWIEHGRALSDGDLRVEAKLESAAGSIDDELGAYEEAYEHEKRAVALLERAVGPDHPSVALQRAAMGAMLRQLGRYEEAQKILERSLSEAEAALGPDHPGLAYPLAGLAAVHLRRNQLDEAKRLTKRKLELVATSDRRVAASTFSLGIAFGRAGDLDEAEKLFRSSEELYTRSLGPDHPRRAWAIYSVGNIAYMRREYAQARDHYARAGTILEQALGADNPQLATIRFAQGQVATGEGDHATAVEHLDGALTILRAQLGDEHARVAKAWTSLGNAQLRLGDHDAAHRSFTAAVQAYDVSLGHEHLDTSWAIHGLGKVADERGEHEAAVTLLREALQIRESEGARAVDVADGQIALAYALANAGQSPEARRLAAKARAAFADAGDAYADRVQEVATWMAR